MKIKITNSPIASFTLSGLLNSGTELDQSLAIIDHRQLLQQASSGLKLEQGISVQLKDIFGAERVALGVAAKCRGLPLCHRLDKQLWKPLSGNSVIKKPGRDIIIVSDRSGRL